MYHSRAHIYIKITCLRTYCVWVTCVSCHDSYLHSDNLHDWLRLRNLLHLGIFCSDNLSHFPCDITCICVFLSLAISSIETYQDWIHLRITCELRHEWLHSRTTYRNDYVWATYDLRQDFMLIQPISPAMLELITPSFEGTHSGSHHVFL